MNNKIFCFLIFVLCLNILSGCGDDKEEIVDHASEIAGTYIGELKVNVGSLEAQASQIIITRTDKNKVKLELKSFEILIPVNAGPLSTYTIEDNRYIIGDIMVEDLEIVASGEYVVIGQKEQNLEITVNNSASQVKLMLSKGKVSEKNLEITASFQHTILGNVTAAFAGTRN